MTARIAMHRQRLNEPGTRAEVAVEASAAQVGASFRSSAVEQLLVFAKYPEVGTVKTRLIPALGAGHATRLHEALTRMTLANAQRVAEQRSCGVQVHFAGGDVATMRAMFGSGLRYESQRGSDLGERLQHAASTAFSAGAERVVIIGTDCPELSPAIVGRAFDALTHNDVVLGPAADGGYYLIGLRRNRPEVFQGVAWGTHTVLQQTIDAARDAACSVAQLQCLSDVDYADDLLACRRVAGAFREVLPDLQPGLLSIIIPTFNEEQRLTQSLAPLMGLANVEVIVADGGSRDATVALARQLGVQAVCAPPGRGRQMNAGAALSRGETLLFLHADTSLPRDFPALIDTALADGAVAGAFRLQIESHSWGLRLVERCANVRARYWQMPYGDQGLFLRSATFFRMGGFRPWPLFEDYELCQRLRKLGRVKLASGFATTSARRWQRLGVVRTTLLNQLCIAGFHLGVTPERLSRWYRTR